MGRVLEQFQFCDGFRVGVDLAGFEADRGCDLGRPARGDRSVGQRS